MSLNNFSGFHRLAYEFTRTKLIYPFIWIKLIYTSKQDGTAENKSLFEVDATFCIGILVSNEQFFLKLVYDPVLEKKKKNYSKIMKFVIKH